MKMLNRWVLLMTYRLQESGNCRIGEKYRETECLNYILRRIKDSADRFALTSIGIDGENRDQVCQTPKPEIIVRKE